MITVQTATNIVLENVLDLGIETLPLHQCMGRVLKENLFADRDFPPFTRVSMDGISIQYAAFEQGQRAFPIAGIQAAGSPPLSLDNPQHCFEVMTGSILPNNTDTVIRYEDVEIKNGIATIQVETIKPHQSAHRQGLDRTMNDLIVPIGKVISSAEIGVAATVGKSHLQVAKLPKIAIISTGDELVNIEETPLPYQIRKSNVHCLQVLFDSWNCTTKRFHILDDTDDIEREVRLALADFDVLVLSGGVSKGKFDFIPEVLAKLGVEKLFHKVQQRPGKPFWFGKAPNGTIVFALPGNPVSSFVSALRYIQPWLRKSLNLMPFEERYAVLAEAISFRPNLTYFLQVRLKNTATGQMLAHPIKGKGSGDLANLVDADGILELPQGKAIYQAGEVYRFYTYRNL